MSIKMRLGISLAGIGWAGTRIPRICNITAPKMMTVSIRSVRIAPRNSQTRPAKSIGKVSTSTLLVARPSFRAAKDAASRARYASRIAGRRYPVWTSTMTSAADRIPANNAARFTLFPALGSRKNNRDTTPITTLAMIEKSEKASVTRARIGLMLPL